MHQIKIFKGIENDLTTLEADVNRWLYNTKIRVVQVFGNIAPQTIAKESHGLDNGGYIPSDVLLVVLYEETI